MGTSEFGKRRSDACKISDPRRGGARVDLASRRAVGSPPLSRPGLGLALLALSLLLPSLVGCQPDRDRPQLIRARFLDETADGKPQQGESILLVFDRDLELREPVRTGLRLLPQGTAGAYTIVPGPNDRTLRVELGVGDLNFSAVGIFGDPTTPQATGVRLDFSSLGVRSGAEELTGSTRIVDLEPSPPDPATLEAARWVDQNNSLTVDQGDKLVLRWDRPVAPSNVLRQYGLRLPEDFAILPVEGDRLDDGTTPARVEAIGRPDRETTILLGSNPVLTVTGTFDPRSTKFTRSPSGIAIRGTDIRPHPDLIDALGIGVISERVVDLEGECSPFLPIQTPSEFSTPGRLSGHTATALPDGRVVLAGGWRESIDGREVSSEIWVYDPWDSAFHGPWKMRERRAWHTATYFEGADGEPDTSDDFILFIGGSTGLAPQVNLEILFTKRPPGRGGSGQDRYSMESSWIEGLGSQRFQHTAHRIPGTDTVVLIGGRSSAAYLTRTIETVGIAYPEPDLQPKAYRTEIGELALARIEHDSILITTERDPMIVVMGGYGGSDVQAQVEFSEGRCSVLDRTEVLRLDPAASKLERQWDYSPHPLLGRRRGAKIVALSEENFPWLVVGGTDQRPYDNDEPSPECAQVLRFDLSLPKGDQRPRFRWTRAGELTLPRAGMEAVRLEDGRVFLIGGAIGDQATTIAEMFDPMAGLLGTVDPICREMLSARGEFPRRNFTATKTYDQSLLRERILIVGGTESDEGPGIEMFRP